MASNSVCASCLRALRQQARKEIQRQPSLASIRPQHTRRLLSTTTRALAAEEQPRSTKRQPSKPSSANPSAFDLSQLASQLRKTDTLRSATEPYIAYGSTEDLFKACARQCDYNIPNVLKQPPEPAPKNAGQEDVGVGSGWWVTPKEQGGLGLDVTFNTWAQVVFLHMYMMTVRLRCFPKEHAGIWHQNLLDHFFYAAEDKMAVWHGMTARGVRNKYLKDLWLQWRGLLLSYDEGLIKGDAVLATAVWRNLFKSSEEADIADVALVTAYMRRQLLRLDEMGDDVFASGEVDFEGPAAVKALAEKQSPWMHKSFSSEDLKELEPAQAPAQK
ncbi:hypothetical protein LTR36_008059 [Oleoguttula mirabilis]|uniref:Ubiquinol-cytochrome c chaperone domain-containing protein n=1 Tax=Oleoguttula mirabilis TaxID=1507867 RepID=A0AAV9J964_9PEZI|nr:hypothetical protein LTR36_008059 [Oleoguttula mirabilis]